VQCRAHGSTFEFLFEFQTEFFSNFLFEFQVVRESNIRLSRVHCTLQNYRIPEHHRKEVDVRIQQMLLDKIIQPSQSPWNFPILIVPKKMDASGKCKWWICVDFWKLNDIMVGDSFPLPNIQDILD
jgi:hypothetical protein